MFRLSSARVSLVLRWNPADIPLVLRSYCCTPRGIKEATLCGRPVLVKNGPLGGRFGCGGRLARSLNLGGCLFALQVSFPALSFLSFVVLFAHTLFTFQMFFACLRAV